MTGSGVAVIVVRIRRRQQPAVFRITPCLSGLKADRPRREKFISIGMV